MTARLSSSSSSLSPRLPTRRESRIRHVEQVNAQEIHDSGRRFKLHETDKIGRNESVSETEAGHGSQRLWNRQLKKLVKEKTVRYPAKKAFADSRPRKGGRFLPKNFVDDPSNPGPYVNPKKQKEREAQKQKKARLAQKKKAAK